MSLAQMSSRNSENSITFSSGHYVCQHIKALRSPAAKKITWLPLLNSACPKFIELKNSCVLYILMIAMQYHSSETHSEIVGQSLESWPSYFLASGPWASNPASPSLIGGKWRLISTSISDPISCFQSQFPPQRHSWQFSMSLGWRERMLMLYLFFLSGWI